MNLLRTLILGITAVGGLAMATPVQAHGDRDYFFYRGHHRYHHWRDGRETIVIERTPTITYSTNSDVSIAFGGHRRWHHRYDRDLRDRELRDRDFRSR